MKEKGRNIFIIVLLIGVIAIVASYYAVMRPYKAKTETLKSEIATLQERVDTLEVYKRNEGTYKADIAKHLEEVATVLDEYPADAKYEDVLMEAVALQNNFHQLKFLTIITDDKEEILNVSDETVQNMNRDEYVSAVGFNKTEATYTSETTYAGLKASLEQILSMDNRVTIASINFQKAGHWDVAILPDGAEEFVLYKSEPLLAGGIVLDYYSVSGTDKVYVAPDMREYENGVNDIFGIIPVKIDEETGLPIVVEEKN